MAIGSTMLRCIVSIQTIVWALAGCSTHFLTGQPQSANHSEFGRVQNAAEETCLKEGPLQSPPTGDSSRQVDPCPTDEAIPVYGVVAGLTDTQAHATSNQLEIDQGERLPESEAVGPSEKPEVDPNTGLFARMRQGFRLDHRLGEPRVQAQARWFEKNPAYLDRVFDRGSKYLFHIVESLEASGLPLEIALLPLVESAFDPFAYSHGRASGLWQFIPGTARLQGLTIDWWFDGRRDVVYSTEAAIDYLSMLNRQFKGDWELTLAAYNGGIGNVRKSIRRRGNDGNVADFWTLDLAEETEAYVPKLLAIAALVADPGAFNYELPIIANKPVFDEVDIGHQIDLTLAAQLASLDVETLYRFNPGLNQWATHPDGPHRLIVPMDAAETFRENLITLAPASRIAWERYKVKSGDTLSEIADRFNVSTEVLMRQNDLNTSRIRTGQALLIPKAIGPKSSLTANGRLASRQRRLSDDPDRSHISYSVRPGDSLWTIARKYGTTTKAIARWNQIGEKSMLQIGQALQLYPKKKKALQTVASPRPSLQKVERTIRYTVKRGDSFGRIANRFQVSIANLRRWNPERAKEKYLQPGDRLVIKINIKQLIQ